MTEQQLQARVSGARALLFLVLLAVAVPVVWVALTAVWHFPQPVYRLTPTRLLVTLAACGIALGGSRALWGRPNPGVSAAALVMTCLWVLTFISFIGMVLVPATLAISLAFALMARKAGGAGGTVLAGVAVAVSLAMLLFAQPWTPAVSCGEHMVRTSGRPFDGNSGSSSGSGMSSTGYGTGHDPDRPTESSGNVSYGEESYVYRCRGAELVEFRRVD